MIRHTIATAALLFSSVFLFSQEQISLSLAQATERALSHNLGIKSSELGVSAAEKQLKSSIAKGLPQVEGSVDYSYFFDYEINFSLGGGSNGGDINYALFDDGDKEIMKLLQSMSSSEPIIMEGSAGAKLQVSQLLFSGQYWVGIQTAKLAKLLAEQQVKKNKTEIIESVSNVYFGIVILQESIEILTKTSKNLDDTFIKTAALVRAGIAEETDTLQIRMAQNSLSNSVKQLERSYDFNNTMLKFLLGIPYETTIILTEDAQNFIQEDAIQEKLTSSFSVENNIDYQVMESQVGISQKMVRLQQMAYTPTLAGFYQYNHKILSTGLDMNPDHIIGVSLQIPIFSSGARHFAVQEAKIKSAQAELGKQLVAEQLTMEMQQAQFNLKNAYENFMLQKENIELAERIYTKTQQKYDYGVASSFELTQTNNSYLEAQSNYLQAYMQLFQAKNALEKLSHSL
ncbi:MAG: TolC family protein [Bacteroidales bacterium]|nr:TolC family protein [Bacteroidales bacterium]NLK81786.1 TolC family protein [Bacteroidales bacterium]